MNRKEDKEDKGSKKDKTAGLRLAFMVGLTLCMILLLGMDLPCVLADGMAFPKQSIGVGLIGLAHLAVFREVSNLVRVENF